MGCTASSLITQPILIEDEKVFDVVNQSELIHERVIAMIKAPFIFEDNVTIDILSTAKNSWETIVSGSCQRLMHQKQAQTDGIAWFVKKYDFARLIFEIFVSI